MSIGFNPFTGNFDLKGSSISGLIGPTGLQGVTGSQGTTGIKGDQGEKGTQGETGLIGAIGETGVGGATGTKGDIGNTGLQGIAGPVGNTGLEGAVGATGLEGAIGNTGVRGETGISGIQGDKGEVGETGIQGIQGDTGIQGIQGNIGETGISGVTGPEGIQGSTGISGLDGEIGPQGTTGLDGVQGTTGLVGIGIQGETGITGEIGQQGTTGLVGEKGDKGNTGDQGVTGISITGATGVDGLKGDQGVTGITGVTGIIGSTGAQGIQGATGVGGGGGATVTGLAGHILTADGSNGIIANTGLSLVSNVLYGSTGVFAGNILLNSNDFNGGAGIQITRGSTGTNGSTITYRKCRGTIESPQGILSGDRMLGFYTQGGMSDGNFSGNSAAFQIMATENYTTTNRGNKLTVELTPNGSTTRGEKLSVSGEGNLVAAGSISGTTGMFSGGVKSASNIIAAASVQGVTGLFSGGIRSASNIVSAATIQGVTGVFSGTLSSIGATGVAITATSTSSAGAVKTSRIQFRGTDTASTLKDVAYIDATSSTSNWVDSILNFSIRGDNALVQKMTITPTGIGMGTVTYPKVQLDVGGAVNTTTCYQTNGVTGISGANISPYSFTVAGGIITGQTGTAGRTTCDVKFDNYTLAIADADKLIGLTGINAKTFTIPENGAVAIPIGTNVAFVQYGSGALTIAGASGVSVLTEVGLKLNAQNATAAALKVDTNKWLLAGSLKA